MKYYLCIVGAVFSLVGVCVAQSDCMIGVRMIQGSEKDLAGVSNQLNVGNFLSDVKSQLQPLPFKRFDVLDSKQQKVGFGTPASFALNSSEQAKHQITVVPHSVQNKRVQLTVNWTNPRGEELLATKLRVVNDKCVVLGTDSSGDTSTIASIRANCQ
jgi:hypothetical protein